MSDSDKKYKYISVYIYIYVCILHVLCCQFYIGAVIWRARVAQ
jgi:hypothetical protein